MKIFYIFNISVQKKYYNVAITFSLKCDLPHRDVNQDEIEYAYKKGNYLGWTEVSAKEGLMVDDCMK